MLQLLSAEIAWYVTGRFYVATDGSVADYGYFLKLAGIDAALFAGAPGAATAHFTFAAQPFVPSSVQNGALSLALDPAGEFSVFLQRHPGADFDDPASFAQGERIATLRRVGLVVGTTVDAGTPSPPAALISSNLFSARLVASAPFDFAGARHDLRDTLGAGVTQLGTAAATAIAPPPPGYRSVVPFSGSAIKLGR